MKLQRGLLISDTNPKTTFEEKIQAAVAAFEARYSARPSLVQVHPSQANGDEAVSLNDAVADGCDEIAIEGSHRVSYRDQFLVIGPIPRQAMGVVSTADTGEA